MSFYSYLFLLCALLCIVPGRAAADERLNRPANLSTTLDPQLYDSNLWETSYQETLDQFYATETEDFGYALAEGLEKTVIRGQIKVLPGYRAEDQAIFRQEAEPDSFLLTIDLRYTYGLGSGSPLAAMATFGTCFLASPVKMFNYAALLEGRVVVYYVNQDQGKIRLLEKDYTSEKKISGSFFEAQEMAQEVKWIRQLTRATMADMNRQMLAELPQELLQRSARKISDELNRAPTLRRSAALPTRAPAAPTTVKGAASATKDLDLPDLIRQVSPSIFKVLTENSSGSGFVISTRGYAVTSLHVVENSEDIRLKFLKGEPQKARVILKDERLDIAILAMAPENLSALALGRSSDLRPGDAAIAIGYGAEFGLSVVPTTITRIENYQGVSLLRIDTQLEEGNSGGPLLDAGGNVIAIDVRRAEGQKEQVSFAIPIDDARRIFVHLLD
jgi:hypothetical protein